MARKKIFVGGSPSDHPEDTPLFQLSSEPCPTPLSVGETEYRSRLQYIAPTVAPSLLTYAEVDVMCEGIDWLYDAEAPAASTTSNGASRPDRVIVNWPPASVSSVNLLLAYQSAQSAADGPDMVSLVVPAATLIVEQSADGTPHERITERLQWNAPTTFWPHPLGLSCSIGACVFHFRSSRVVRAPLPPLGVCAAEFERTFSTANLEELHEMLYKRNTRQGWVLPPALSGTHNQTRRSSSFPLQTGQEWTALLQTAADGRRLYFFVGQAQGTAIRHQRPNAPFWTETHLTCEEICAGFGLEILQRAASELDLDSGLIWLYISHLLAPRGTLERSDEQSRGTWIDLEDVARKTLGGYADNPRDALERRRKVWHAIKYGARTVVSGQRSIPYFDKSTGQTINTRIETTPWQILSRQKPVQLPFGHEEEPPLRVELAISSAWIHLTASPQTAQFLPLGELLGAISPSRASGAWARALGMAYFHWCRLHLSEALNGGQLPSREFLIEQFPPRNSDFHALLAGNDPARAIKYWCDAEDILREVGVLEAATSARKPHKRKGWSLEWKNESPQWVPGPRLREALEGLARNRPYDRTASVPSGAPKRGRPIKKSGS